MKVKVQNMVFDSDDQPVMVVLSKKEKELISQMTGENHKFCVYPDGYKKEAIEKFMED